MLRSAIPWHPLPKVLYAGNLLLSLGVGLDISLSLPHLRGASSVLPASQSPQLAGTGILLLLPVILIGEMFFLLSLTRAEVFPVVPPPVLISPSGAIGCIPCEVAHSCVCPLPLIGGVPGSLIQFGSSSGSPRWQF